MRTSLLAFVLAIFMAGCSSFSFHGSSHRSAGSADEDAFFVPKSIKAVGVDPMATVYTYSKADIIASVFFDFDKSEPRSEYLKRVESAYNFFAKNNELRALIVGHCDHFGTQAYNNKLGLKRAENVKNRLIELGISEDRIIVASVGSEQAKEMSTNRDVTIADRRADIVLLDNIQ